MSNYKILLLSAMAIFSGNAIAQNVGEVIDLLPEGVTINIATDRKPAKQKALTVCGTPQKGYKAYFAATDAEHGEELWVTDGTKEGTHMVKDIVEGTGGSNPSWMGRLNDKCLFSAYTDDAGQELWVTDGTEEGTKMICDCYSVGDGDPKSFMQMNEKQAYFIAIDDESAEYDPDGGAQYWVWVTDGTEEGTHRVSDKIKVDFPGKEYTNQMGYACVRVGRRVFFKGDDVDGHYGTELCVTDGTEAGTYLVKDINYEANQDKGDGYTRDSAIDQFVNYNNKLCHLKAWTPEYGNERWASDGTEEGTYQIWDSRTGKEANGIGISGDAFGPGAEVYRGRIWSRIATDSIGDELGGTNCQPGDAVAYDVNDLAPTANNSAFVDPGCEFQGMYFFCATHGFDANLPETNFGGEMWFFDGLSKPRLQYNFCPGTKSDWVKEQTVAGGSLYWYNEANDDPSVYGNGLYRLDDKDSIPVVCPQITSTGDAVFSLRNLGGQILYCSNATHRIYTFKYHKDGWDGKSDMGNLEPIFDGVTDHVDPAYVDPYLKALDPTGIENVNTEAKAASSAVYTLDGRQVRTAGKGLQGLNKGIYIVNGKKEVVR